MKDQQIIDLATLAFDSRTPEPEAINALRTIRRKVEPTSVESILTGSKELPAFSSEVNNIRNNVLATFCDVVYNTAEQLKISELSVRVTTCKNNPTSALLFDIKISGRSEVSAKWQFEKILTEILIPRINAAQAPKFAPPTPIWSTPVPEPAVTPQPSKKKWWR